MHLMTHTSSWMAVGGAVAGSGASRRRCVSSRLPRMLGTGWSARGWCSGKVVPAGGMAVHGVKGVPSCTLVESKARFKLVL